MFSYKIIVISLSTFIFFACDSDSNKEVENIPSTLTGTWKGICQTADLSSGSSENRIVTYKFGPAGQDGRYSGVDINYKFYETSSCITEKSNVDIVATYEIGEEITTDTGLVAYEIDIRNGDISLLKSIFRIEQTYLYLGLENQNIPRPKEINFSFWHEKLQ